MDANFRLKLKDRGINDPEVGSGWSYFVKNDQYSKHLSENTAEIEVSSFVFSFGYETRLTYFQAVGCTSDFHAVSQANTKFSKDYITSGVVACICARHSFVQKNGIADLQRGERYVLPSAISVQILMIMQIYQHGLCYCLCIERARCPQRRYFVRHCLQMVNPPPPTNLRQSPRS